MNKDHVEIWNSCLSVIKDNVTEQGYKTWFEPIVPLSLTDNVLTLQVPTQFFYEYLEVHYIDLLKTVIKRFVGQKESWSTGFRWIAPTLLAPLPCPAPTVTSPRIPSVSQHPNAYRKGPSIPSSSQD